MIAWCDNGFVVVLIIIIKSLTVIYSSIYGERICLAFALKYFSKNKKKSKRAERKTDETRPAKC